MKMTRGLVLLVTVGFAVTLVGAASIGDLRGDCDGCELTTYNLITGASTTLSAVFGVGSSDGTCVPSGGGCDGGECTLSEVKVTLTNTGGFSLWWWDQLYTWHEVPPGESHSWVYDPSPSVVVDCDHKETIEFFDASGGTSVGRAGWRCSSCPW